MKNGTEIIEENKELEQLKDVAEKLPHFIQQSLVYSPSEHWDYKSNSFSEKLEHMNHKFPDFYNHRKESKKLIDELYDSNKQNISQEKQGKKLSPKL